MQLTIKKEQKTEIRILNSLYETKKINTKFDKALLITDNFCQKNFADKIEYLKKITSNRIKTFVLHKNNKDLNSYLKAINFLVKYRFNRNSAIIALGGGNITDLSGFIAATYMRGIKAIFIPTTFLSQIDAALGGKNAINVKDIKNIIGTFNNPQEIICDISFNNPITIKQGLGELFKYIILDRDKFPKNIDLLFEKLMKNEKKILKQTVKKALEIKLNHIKIDPFDSLSIREKLNLGHTPAHAFEFILKEDISHGDAVFWGIIYILILSEELFAKRQISEEFYEIAMKHKPNIKLDKIDFNKFIYAIEIDKKNRNYKNKFLVFKNNRIISVKNIEKKILYKSLMRLKNEYKKN